MAIYTRLEHLRLGMGLTRKELAAKLGFRWPNMIMVHEQPRYRPRMDRLLANPTTKALEKFFGLSIQELRKPMPKKTKRREPLAGRPAKERKDADGSSSRS